MSNLKAFINYGNLQEFVDLCIFLKFFFDKIDIFMMNNFLNLER
jgi:hypothetical protein